MTNSRQSNFSLTQPGPLRLYSTVELLALPPPTWLIAPVLPAGGLVGLYGQPRAGKSFIAIDMALSVAYGVPWQAYPVDPGYVVYVSAEGGTGIGKRVLAWLQHHKLPAKPADIAWLVESIPIYASSEQMALLLNRIVDEVQRHPSLIVVDTLARCFDGDENQQEDMGRFIAGVDILRHEFGATLLIVHHTNVGGERERGNTAFRGAAETMIAVSRDMKEDLITLECTKQKDAKEIQFSEALELKVVEGTDSCVVVDAAISGKQADLLEILKNLGPLSWEAWFSSANVSRGTFFRYFAELRKTNKIIKENGLWRPMSIESVQSE